jgi:hypothetical protein
MRENINKCPLLKQIGNSMSVNVIKHILISIYTKSKMY